MIHYSIGDNTFDSHPTQHDATDFDDLCGKILSLRSPRKGMRYVCAPLGPDDSGRPHRSKDAVLPTSFLCMDLDGCRDIAAFNEIIAYLNYDMYADALWYTTASHTDESPRARIVLHLSRPVSRAECMRLGVAVETTLRRALGDCSKFDRTVYRPEQPNYTPLRDNTERTCLHGRITGLPLDVDALLADESLWADAEDHGTDSTLVAAETTAADPIFAALEERGLLGRQLKPGQWSITCPFAEDHTSDSGETSSIYLLPHFGGYLNGNFDCKHAHCVDRQQRDFVAALGLDPDAVRGSGASALSFEEAVAGLERERQANGGQPFLIPGDDFISAPAPINWLIRGWLQEEALAMIHGPSGAGKTFMAVDWALHLATGRPTWFDQICHGGPTVYLAGEGHYGLRARAKAWAVHHNAGSLGDIVFSSAGAHLDTVEGLMKVRKAIRALPWAPKAIFVDTVHASMQGDENKAQDVAKVLAACRALILEFQCTVVLVHHTGLSAGAQERARGSGAWRGGLENEVSVVAAADGKPIQIVGRKQKDSELGETLWAVLERVNITDWPLDRDGFPVSSVVFCKTDYVEMGVSKENLRDGPRRALRAFEALAVVGEGISKSGWKESYFDLFRAEHDNEGSLRKAWTRDFNAATSEKLDLFRLDGDFWHLI